MKTTLIFFISCFGTALVLSSCAGNPDADSTAKQEQPAADPIREALNAYKEVELKADLSALPQGERLMIPLLLEAAAIMDTLFWLEANGEDTPWLDTLTNEPMRRLVEINYGPWNRLNDNKPFVPGIGPKPEGAFFYPTDVSREEVENHPDEAIRSQYTMVRRDSTGQLVAIPYHEYFARYVNRAADLLDSCAALTDHAGFKKYLALRAEALRTDNYQPSDLAWMDMKGNLMDVVIGPIENYEDKLFNYKTAHEAYILITDTAWSARLAKYAALLPELQRGIPADEVYKQEQPGSNADLNAYDAIYYAGDCNAGSKTIAINLPNDEQVQLAKGSRRLQLKNVMRAKFDHIMVPIAEELLVKEQQKHITFDAFFANTMFHEVAHGLGIKNTITKKGTVREALREHYSALEEGKADVLGLYMITQLHDQGLVEGNLEDYYTTFMAGIFRSVRFGSASAHGTANMLRFNFFEKYGAFTRDESGKYTVHFDKCREAMDALSAKILKYQGDGNYEAVAAWVESDGNISEGLASDLKRLEKNKIPVDVVFKQGMPLLSGL